MLDPRISMGARVSPTTAVDTFNKAMMNNDQMAINKAQEARSAALAPFKLQQAQQGVDANQQSLDQNRQQQRLANINQTGQRLKPFLDSGDTQGAQKFMLDNISSLQSRIEAGENLDITESMETLAKLQSGDTAGVLADINAVSGLVGGGSAKKQFALQSNAPIVDPKTGQVSTPVFDPSTGQTDLVPIEGAIQETPTQSAAREQRSQQNTADREVRTTKLKEEIKTTVARVSSLKKEFSDRRRGAARSTIKVKEAQKLAEKALQGIGGVATVQLGRLFPGIDAKDEGALSSALKGLALDELQKFKGPTTDFEFAVTEDIAGSLGGGASANKARLASLERSNWFIDRESQQFNDHIKAGHDPDEFFFNFNELLTPKKGGKSYSLQSIQDTAVANHIGIDEVIKRLSK